MKINIVHSYDDWVLVYVNNELVCGDHSLFSGRDSEKHFLDAIAKDNWTTEELDWDLIDEYETLIPDWGKYTDIPRKFFQ
jgi:hypothetical protein